MSARSVAGQTRPRQGQCLAAALLQAKMTYYPMDTTMIDVSRDHSLDDDQVRSVVQAMADKLAERFEVVNHWDGDALRFARSGVEGRITLLPGQVRVTAELGFPYSMMQPMVQAEIERVLEQRLG